MEYSEIFKALSNRTRLRAFYTLLQSKRELCICEIMDSVGIRAYNASRCMKELKVAGLVTERKEGRWVFYKVNDMPDKFLKMTCGLISSLPQEEFKEDLSRFKKRMSLRQFGKCVIGMKNSCCK